MDRVSAQANMAFLSHVKRSGRNQNPDILEQLKEMMR